MLIQNEIFECEKKISTLAEKISEARHKVCSLSIKLVNSVEIMLHYKYIESMNLETEQLKETIKSLRINEQKVKSQLLEKSKERKSLERLKDIKFEEYRKDYNKEQQLFLDEISIQHHRYKKEAYS
jgi:flagellar FliJ protein